jgi:endonuclease-3
LKERFPQWEDVLQAKINSVVQAIKPGGLAKQKAKRIRDILRRIKKQNETLSLDFLKEMDSEEIKEMMGSLKGIGPKTVHCLLLFGLGREAFPVDTHVLRVGKRLGFIPEKTSSEKAHPWMVLCSCRKFLRCISTSFDSRMVAGRSTLNAPAVFRNECLICSIA